jgi:hypothetical protein
LNPVDREYFIGKRIVNFCGEDTLNRVTKFIDNKDWEWKAAELYSLLIEHHCASTGRANASARAWRLAGIGSWIVTIITICLALGLSGKVDLVLVLAFGVIAFFVLICALVVIYSQMWLSEHPT